MNRISLVAWVALSSCLVACSGRYEVGGEGGSATGTGGLAGSGAGRDDVAGSRSGAFAGTAPSSGGLAGAATGVGAGNFDGSACEPKSGPPPVVGDLVEPAVVWERVARLVEGEGAPPPSNLPSATTYEWAGDVVTQAFGRARMQGTTTGASSWLNHWLFRTAEPPEPALEADWGGALLADAPVLERLLLEPVGANRRGVFMERAWLRSFPSISARGAGVRARVFGTDVPAPPEGVPAAVPVPMMTRRQELSAAIEPPACASCHALMDDLGFAYGHFDEQGDYEELDDGLPIDTSGRFGLVVSSAGPDPVLFDFADALELGAKASASCEARQGVVLSFARAALDLEGLSLDAQYALVEPQRERMQRAFSFSKARSYEDLVRAYAQSPLVLQR